MTGRVRTLALALGIGVLCAIAYGPLPGFRFIQDDHGVIQNNPLIHQGDARALLTTDYWAGVGGGDTSLYRPVTLLSFLLERDDAGRVDPHVAHVTNIALHGLAALLLFVLARRAGAGEVGSAVAALLFAVHPIHVSAVAPLTGRAELLATLFSLAALLALSAAGPWPAAGGGRPPGPGRARLAAWSAGGLLFLALGSKEVAVATPVIMAALVLLYRAPTAPRAAWLERVGALAPSALAAAAHLALRSGAVGGLLRTQAPPLSDNPLAGLAGVESLATRLGLAARYALQLFFPARLSADYSGPVIPPESTLLAPRPLLGLAALAVVAALALGPLAARLRSRQAPGKREAVALAAWLLLAPYLVIGNLIVLVGVIYAERLLYYPSAGFCLLLGIGGGALHERLSRRAGAAWIARVGLAVVLAAVLGSAAWHTRRESRHWRNEDTLFTAALRTTPRNPRAHFTLAKIRIDQGRLAEAYEHLERAVELWPDFSSAWYEKGELLARRGDLAGAAEAFRRAASIHPGHAAAQLSLGIALHRLGRLAEAERQLRETRRRFPGMPAAEAELGHLWMTLGRFGEAAAAYRRAIAGGRRDLRDALARAEALEQRDAAAPAAPPGPRR